MIYFIEKEQMFCPLGFRFLSQFDTVGTLIKISSETAVQLSDLSSFFQKTFFYAQRQYFILPLIAEKVAVQLSDLSSFFQKTFFYAQSQRFILPLMMEKVAVQLSDLSSFFHKTFISSFYNTGSLPP